MTLSLFTEAKSLHKHWVCSVKFKPPVMGSNVLQFPGAQQSSSSSVATINDLEAQAIEKAIQSFRGNLTEAAKALGIGRATLYRKVKLYNIDPSQARRRRAA